MGSWHCRFLTLASLLVSLPASAAERPPALTSVALNPATVTGGASSIGTATLTGPAPSSDLGVVVGLSSSDVAVAAVPEKVTVPPGATTASFVVETFPVTTSTLVTISAQRDTSDTKSSAVTVVPPSIAILGCDQFRVAAGRPLTCKVWLDGKVASGAVVVALASSNQAVATVPSSVSVGEGQKMGSFTVTAQPIAQAAPVIISASYNGVTKTAPVTVLPVPVWGVSISWSSTPGEDGYEGMVYLTVPAPMGGLDVRLSSSHPALVSIPPRVSVPEGKDAAGFKIQTKPVAADTPVTISTFSGVTSFGNTKTATLRVFPPRLDVAGTSGNVVSSVPWGGREVRAWVRLSGPAPMDASVNLQYSGQTDITGPLQVTVPYNEREQNFTITVFPCSVSAQCEVVISASYGGSTKKAKLTVKP